MLAPLSRKSPNFRTGIGADVHATVWSTNPSTNLSFSYTLEKYYDNTSPNSVIVWFWLIPIASQPTFNWTTQTWSRPAGSSTRWIIDPTTAAIGEGAFQRTNVSLTFQYTDVAVGNYRLYMQVDASSLISETDEGDNMVPTNFTLRRL